SNKENEIVPLERTEQLEEVPTTVQSAAPSQEDLSERSMEYQTQFPTVITIAIVLGSGIAIAAGVSRSFGTACVNSVSKALGILKNFFLP
ncbi:MAG: hypothetical protein RRZ73_06715, partial [Oscillospiraceae bacterium]